MTDNPADLSKLHDIVVPEAVSWWPLAPAWWVLVGLLAIGSALGCLRLLRRWRADAYRRTALRALATARSPIELSTLLRRVALAIAPRDTIAALSDEEWIDWLNERNAQPVPAEVERILCHSLYAPEPSGQQTETLRRFADEWIRHHHRPC